MPIAESQMTHEEMTKTASNHVCGECGGRLNVAWSAENNGYILRCNDLTHNKITSHLPKSERIKEAEKEWNKTNKMDSKALTTMPENQMLARIGMAKFPQELTIQDKRLLAQVAITYGLDPLMGEVSIFQGRPYVSIDGRYRKAQETGELDGVESCPATKQERTDWQIPDGDYFFRAEVYKKGSSRPFVGWGRVRTAEINPQGKFKPIDVNPQRQAEKRAEAQGLRKAFHIPLPSLEDIGTPEAETQPYINGEVVQETGEIINNQPVPEGEQQASVSPGPTESTSQAEEFDKLESASGQKQPSESILQGQKPKATAANMRIINAHKQKLGEDKFWDTAHALKILTIADMDTEQASALIGALNKAKIAGWRESD